MPAPVPERPPATSPSVPVSRRRRPLLLGVAAVLAVAAVGAGVALATRPSPRPAVTAVDAGTVGQDQPVGQAPAQVSTSQVPGGKVPAGHGAEPAARTKPDTAKGAAVLPDGVHHALIRRVDVAGDRVTVDVVQLFLDGDAVRAALADGKPREEARVLTVWLRNQSPRLRTLPLAADLRVDLFQGCDETPDRRAMLTQLAGNARLGVYFYSLTVRDGSVQTIKERQITPAC